MGPSWFVAAQTLGSLCGVSHQWQFNSHGSWSCCLQARIDQSIQTPFNPGFQAPTCSWTNATRPASLEPLAVALMSTAACRDALT